MTGRGLCVAAAVFIAARAAADTPSPAAVAPAPVSATAASAAEPLPASALAPVVMTPAATVYEESTLRRCETIAGISLPFCALYSVAVSALTALAIEGKHFTLDNRVIIPTVSLTVLSAAWIVWTDARAPAPAAIPAAP